MLDATARFVAKTAPAPDGSGCLLWTASFFNDGYGCFSVGRRTVRAHRWAYEQHHGVTLRTDQHVLHSCDTPACVLVAHLRVGSNADNMRDMVERRRQLYGERNTKAILTQAQVDQIRARYARGTETQVALAKAFNVSQQTISVIVRGERWTIVA